MLDLFGFLLLLLPFAFFWAGCPCCKAVCTECPDGVGRQISVLLPGIEVYDDPCGYCEELSERLFILEGAEGGNCHWTYSTDWEEGFCREIYFEDIAMVWLGYVKLHFSVLFSNDNLKLLFSIETDDMGTYDYEYICPMPDFEFISGSTWAGPCPPQELELALGAFPTSEIPWCDLKTALPVVTFL